MSKTFEFLKEFQLFPRNSVKPVVHIKPSEANFPVGMSENCLLDSENWFLEFGLLKYWVLDHPTGTWVDFKSC